MMKERAFAKINLALDVVSRREDGYHELRMIMVPIMLHDLIYINQIEEGIEITSNHPFVPTNQKNIMYKAAKAMIDQFNIPFGVSITIYKHIPIQAGLGGGSADGAAVLRAMNSMFDLQLSKQQLARIGKEVGSDIPFCIYQQYAYVQGIGEKLEFIKSDFDCYVLLVKPKKGISTKVAFETLDLSTCDHPDIINMKEKMIINDYQGVVACLGNSLEQPSLTLVEDIKNIKEELVSFGFDGALMSGSGSCVFGLTKDREVVERGYLQFKKKYPFVNKTKLKRQNESWEEYAENS